MQPVLLSCFYGRIALLLYQQSHRCGDSYQVSVAWRPLRYPSVDLFGILSLTLLYTISSVVSGYNHKMKVLIQRILDAIEALPNKLTEELFHRVTDKLSQQYQSFLFSQPYQHAFYGADLCLLNEKWTVEERMAVIEKLTRDDLIQFAKRLLNCFHLEVLIHGNVSPDEAKDMTKELLDGLNPARPFPSTLPQLRVVQLNPGTDYVYRFKEFNDTNTNSSVKVLYQIGPMDLRTNATLAFIAHLVKEPAFNELRTAEQLGYIVHSQIDTCGDDIKGLVFLIQSDAFDPVHLDSRIEAFVDRFRSKIMNMSAEEFQTNVEAVVKSFMEKVRCGDVAKFLVRHVVFDGNELSSQLRLRFIHPITT